MPLGTAAIEPALPSNPQLQLLLQQARRSMIAGSGRIVMVRPRRRKVLCFAVGVVSVLTDKRVLPTRIGMYVCDRRLC